ncbi:helix-turn-helix transcriptional regulator [Arthrobacter agilis]|uniref:Helix-turn-helix transcriptional regulator n=1 Tax=Arthrobacter agilis TaxID=37921 RepID=A0A2L0UH43_9MICC|nr:LuxR C-terminal-related transcriptional regulator [Arthrobacter agilis]AUZ88547.1 helix-turn-helix transcriptional regulator [Arthrobacter agilis]
MAGPLLDAKLRVPLRRRGVTERPRVDGLLERGTECTLTLVSAPAGFGKTTLLAGWLESLAAAGWSTAWLSLDQGDNDPARFWTYLVTALETASSGVGAVALSLLGSAQPSTDFVLGTLLNDLRAVSGDVVLVLDDYHVIEAREIQEGIAFLVAHLPPHVHLVLGGRADPVLPLARLRARGELLELRAADLRFTGSEAASYLNGSMGLGLGVEDVAALGTRTEGWIAALQLAALSMQGREDPTAFIADFAGDDRYIVDFLTEEVLLNQPDDVRDFLLRTSVLERLNGPLCDAVTGQDDGRLRLAALERANLFLVPLDNHRQSYRYHQLFADVLQARLVEERGEELPGLHRRASTWYEQNGAAADAIRHALAAGDVERAAGLIERAVPAIRQDRQEALLRAWSTVLPDDVVRCRPVLGVGLAGALLVGGEIGGVEARLQDVERWLDPSATAADDGGPAMVVVDPEQFRRLPETIAVYRAALALGVGDIAGTIGHARHALALAPTDDHLSRAAARGLLGLAYWGTGQLEAAHGVYADSMAGLYRAGHVADTFGCAIALADIRLAQGRLDDAMRTYEQALANAATGRDPVLRGTADMYVGLSGICRERGDLQGAARHLARSQELGAGSELPQNLYRRRVAMARIREAEGDLAGAFDLLDTAERLYVGDYFPDVRPVAALKARIRVAQGRVGDALGWVRDRGLSPDDELSYIREFEHITLARVLLARSTAEGSVHPLDEATRLLGRLLDAAEDGGRTGSIIEILVLQASAGHLRGDLAAALAPLQRALTLAGPEGHVRVFLDEGAPMASLLRAAAKQQPSSVQLRRLLTSGDDVDQAAPGNPGLIEPLSDRELEVLRLLGTDLDGPDIARELMVSLNTLRTHTRHIYTKLGVTNRRAAVRRARELDLIVHSTGR